jgi:methylenetetrahydrofolate reductase (NADPH)
MCTVDQLQRFVHCYSIETTPGSAQKIESYAALIPQGTQVAVTFLPGSDYNDTVRTCERLVREGMVPVPHIAARSLQSDWEFEDYTDKLREAGAQDCVVLAGAVAQPQGPFSDSMAILDKGRLEAKGFFNIGVAGHPEGSPDIPEHEVERALLWKAHYAQNTYANLYIVTQFVFEAEPIIDWDQKLRQKGVNLPLHIGVPGLATLKTLINHARACGIGNSMRFLTRQARNVTKLMTVSSPDALLIDLAEHAEREPHSLIQGAHFYPLGGMTKTANWVENVRTGHISVQGREIRVQ